MKKLALVLILTVSVLFSSTCWGEWTRVARSGSGQDIYYLDFEKIKERKGLIYFQKLSDHLKPLRMGAYSSVNLVVIDCEKFLMKPLKWLGFEQSMGNGKVLSTDNMSKYTWVTPAPTSAWEIVSNKVCDFVGKK